MIIRCQALRPNDTLNSLDHNLGGMTSSAEAACTVGDDHRRPESGAGRVCVSVQRGSRTNTGIRRSVRRRYTSKPS